MSCLAYSIAQSAPCMQAQIEKVRNASSLAWIVLAGLQLGKMIAVKVIEEILNERGQMPDEGGLCPKCGKKLESNGLRKREILTLAGRVSGDG